jgi:hypothetical protein
MAMRTLQTGVPIQIPAEMGRVCLHMLCCGSFGFDSTMISCYTSLKQKPFSPSVKGLETKGRGIRDEDGKRDSEDL